MVVVCGCGRPRRGVGKTGERRGGGRGREWSGKGEHERKGSGQDAGERERGALETTRPCGEGRPVRKSGTTEGGRRRGDMEPRLKSLVV